MADFVWAIGFDWNETQASAGDSTKLQATMCMSQGQKKVPIKNGRYQVICNGSSGLDFVLFDRTDWGKQVPAASSISISSFYVQIEKASDAFPGQARSPIGAHNFLATNINYDITASETTPCFPKEVSGHTWDTGSATIQNDGRFEVTITFDVTYGQTTKSFQKDPEMEVSDASGYS